MKPERKNEDQIRRTLVERGRWSSRGGFDRYHAALFRGVDFRGRRVLDVGGGLGTCSFLAVAAGAAEAICLDPEAAGATSGTGAVFSGLAAELGIDNAHIEPTTLQSYVAPPRSFDVVIFHNSINHVEEAACIELERSEEARRAYRAVFTQVADLSRPGADLIIAAYLPLFAFQRVEAKLFSPMVYAVGYAQLGALLFAMFVAWIMGDHKRLEKAQLAAKLGGRALGGHTIRTLPGPFAGWASARDVPNPPTQSFRDWWKKNRDPKGGRS